MNYAMENEGLVFCNGYHFYNSHTPKADKSQCLEYYSNDAQLEIERILFSHDGSSKKFKV